MIKFTKEELTSEEVEPYIGLPYDTEPGVIISDKIIDHCRWTIRHELIFNHIPTGKIYRTYYHVGATEQQDERPWEYDEFVECEEVEAYEKTITDYRPVL